MGALFRSGYASSAHWNGKTRQTHKRQGHEVCRVSDPKQARRSEVYERMGLTSRITAVSRQKERPMSLSLILIPRHKIYALRGCELGYCIGSSTPRNAFSGVVRSRLLDSRLATSPVPKRNDVLPELNNAPAHRRLETYKTKEIPFLL